MTSHQLQCLRRLDRNDRTIGQRQFARKDREDFVFAFSYIERGISGKIIETVNVLVETKLCIINHYPKTLLIMKLVL
jgi:hypothetical protein